MAFVGSEFIKMFSKTSNTATVGSGNKAIPTLVYQLEGNPRNVSHHEVIWQLAVSPVTNSDILNSVIHIKSSAKTLLIMDLY